MFSKLKSYHRRLTEIRYKIVFDDMQVKLVRQNKVCMIRTGFIDFHMEMSRLVDGLNKTFIHEIMHLNLEDCTGQGQAIVNGAS